MNNHKSLFFIMACIGLGLMSGCQDADSGVPNQKAVDALANLDEGPADDASGTSSSETEKPATKNGDIQAAQGDASADASKAGSGSSAKAIATFGNGCYWCTEAVFQELNGIHSVVSGFSGGQSKDVTYREVCEGTTGHAEVVHVEYDPSKVSYAELLQAFFLTHNPTTLNRQGADVGTQYRSAIFYHDEQQKQLAEKAIEELTAAEAFPDPIVTEVSKFSFFIPAMEKHQDYFDKNPTDRYCLYNIPSKVKKIRKIFKDKLRNP
ncbi:MAG: peptide-methionine (S)-S-oxide reductase MsrA [Planctomycetaceae bacterium]